MSKRTSRVLISAAVLTTAFTLLFFMTVASGDAQYYKHVDEVMNSPAPWYGKAMQLHGFVVDGSVLKRTDSMDYKFSIKYGDYSVGASYTGLMPDTFKDGSEVVLRGRLAPDGFHVDPNGVVAKCPSRYTAANPPAGSGR
jgi:cytochrome c-type biogenesis protein CcmE